MDFLLECIGFPPDHDLGQLVQLIQEKGESAAWRGPGGTHLRYPLAKRIEIRLDREDDQLHWTLWPHYEVTTRLRVAVRNLTLLPDSPFDVLLQGMANPPLPDDPDGDSHGSDYPLATYLSDARRLPRSLTQGHVLAVSIAGFALDVSYLGPNQGVKDPYILDEPCGAQILPIEGSGRPGGCMELSLRIRSLRHFENPLTGERVDVLETDAPGRPLELFVSRWQLEAEEREPPRPGWRIEGAFLFTGRVSGGLPPRRRRGSDS